MRHLKAGRKLNRTSSHKRALMRSLATALFEHKKISTTEAKAKELRPFAEQLITRAKIALARESQGQLPDGHSVDVHNRRIVARDIQNKAVLQELFDSIAPVVESRPGGYTRITKTGFRRGDAGRTAIIELVDWSAPQDGSVSLKPKKKKKVKPIEKAEPEIETFDDEEEIKAEETADAKDIAQETESDEAVAEESSAKEEAVSDETTEEPIAEDSMVEVKTEEPVVEAKAEEPRLDETNADNAPEQEAKSEAPVEIKPSGEAKTEEPEAKKTESVEEAKQKPEEQAMADDKEEDSSEDKDKKSE